jgi:hypothetical protein
MQRIDRGAEIRRGSQRADLGPPRGIMRQHDLNGITVEAKSCQQENEPPK